MNSWISQILLLVDQGQFDALFQLKFASHMYDREVSSQRPLAKKRKRGSRGNPPSIIPELSQRKSSRNAKKHAFAEEEEVDYEVEEILDHYLDDQVSISVSAKCDLLRYTT